MENYRQIITAKIEYPRRRQVFDDSMRIRGETNCFDVFYRRADEISNFIKWIMELQKAGVRFETGEDEMHFKERVSCCYNINCLRLARYIHGVSKKRILTSLIRLRGSLLDCDNKEEVYNEITLLKDDYINI